MIRLVYVCCDLALYVVEIISHECPFVWAGLFDPVDVYAVIDSFVVLDVIFRFNIHMFLMI